MASLLRTPRAVGGRRVSPWPDYSRLAWARAQRRIVEAHSACTSPWIRTRRLQQQLQSVALWNTKCQDRLALSSALDMYLHHQTRGSRRGLERLGLTRSAAHSARFFEPPDHNNSSWSRRFLESQHPQWVFRFSRSTRRLFRFASCTAKNAIGIKTWTQNLNRTGSSD